jgi:mannosyltransferase
VLAWTGPALVSLLLSGSMIGRTSWGRDELATWEFAHLSVPDLFRAVHHIDGVLAPYYLLMHLWSVGGYGVVWMRLPSVLAVAVAVAVAARAAYRAWGFWAGLLTGTALALHPVVAAEAVEARPYALVLMLCTIATVEALAPGPLRRRRYAAVMAAATVLHLFACLVVVAHVLIRRRRDLMAPAAVVAVVALPLALVAHAQRIALAWLGPATADTSIRVLRAVSAPGDYLWILLGALAVIVVGRARDQARRAAAPAVALVLAPFVLLVVASHLLSPVLDARYLVAAPLGAAVVVGGAAGVVRRRPWLAAVITVAVCAAAVPGVRAVHRPRIDGADYPGLARILAREAAPGDGLEVAIRRSEGGTAAGVAYYIGDHAFLDDIIDGLPDGAPLTYRREFAGPGRTVPASGPRSTTWLVAVAGTTPAHDAVQRLLDDGCRIVGDHALGELVLYQARCDHLP